MATDGDYYSGQGSGDSFDEENDVLAIDKKDCYYKMDHKKRGSAIIFNHEHFQLPGLDRRTGTQVDCKNLKLQLKKLHFDVVVHHNLNHEEVHRRINEASKVDYTNCDCFLLIVLSHGDKGILFANDCGYNPERLWRPFTSDNAPTLAGKPKMFFIQACQGSDSDGGVTLSQIETDGPPHSYKIPTHADFLIAYSTISGFVSWRNARGSWFVEALCNELEENGFSEDLLTLLTFVCERVALDYESSVPHEQDKHARKQIPCITNTLTKLVKFSKHH